MRKNNNFKVAALAASIALAMGSTAAMAAATAPLADQLPGQGAVVSGHVSAGTATGGQQTITIGNGTDTGVANAVINWGTGTDINGQETGGFNLGANAVLNFADGTVNGASQFGAAVLNIDSSGNASQIFGHLSGTGPNTSIFVANENGIIVGSGGAISTTGDLGLITNHITGGNDSSFNGLSSIAYDGTGGDVSVMSGASVSGNTVLVAGGGNVNVNLAALTGASASTSLSAGESSPALGVENANASLAVSGVLATGVSLGGFNSAGTASNSGTLTVGGYGVTGVLTNTGTLNTSGTANLSGGLNNIGTYNANAGTVNVTGGNLINSGTINTANTILVTDGGIYNMGFLNGVYNLSTASDTDRYPGADYSIFNNGTISSQAALTVDANRSVRDAADMDSTGSFSNALGKILVGAGGDLKIKARNNITLAGSVQTHVGSTASDLSASNPMGFLTLSSSGFDLTSSTPTFFASGVTDVSVPVWASGVILHGNQVKVMNNISSVASGSPSGTVSIVAGPSMLSSGDYAIRVAGGKTISASAIAINGSAKAVQPNVILQGTLSADTLNLGTASQPISDMFSGATGGVVATGTTPFASIAFTGRVKIAPYLNDSNFRYNYFPIMATDGPLTLTLKPISYTTNGTSNGLSAVNVLVDGDVNIIPPVYISSPAIYGTGSATGPNVIPNTHLVVQSSGNIATTGEYYWPGYVYLGNIGNNMDGSAAPGTMGNGTIALGGNFSNTLPGSVDLGGGIHFITKNPLDMGSYTVTTNANSWVNFGTDALTQQYVSGQLGAGLFFGGVQGSGSVVNYGALDASLFHPQPPVATR